jgi:hypothetical protein
MLVPGQTDLLDEERKGEEIQEKASSQRRREQPEDR